MQAFHSGMQYIPLIVEELKKIDILTRFLETKIDEKIDDQKFRMDNQIFALACNEEHTLNMRIEEISKVPNFAVLLPGIPQVT